MPFKSKAQMRKFYAMANRGEISKEEADQWSHETKDIKGLPERVTKSPNKKRNKKKKTTWLS